MSAGREASKAYTARTASAPASMASRPSRARAACAEAPVRRICTSRGGGHERPRSAKQSAPTVDAGLHVHGEDAPYVDTPPARRSLPRSGARRRPTSSAGWKMTSTLQGNAFTRPREPFAESQHGRHVGVVAAGVHPAGMFATRRDSPPPPVWAARPCRSERRWSPPVRRQTMPERRWRRAPLRARPVPRELRKHIRLRSWAGRTPLPGCGAGRAGGGG